MGVVCRVGAAIACSALHKIVNVFDAVDDSLRFLLWAECGGGKKVGGALQAAPRVGSVVGVVGHASHGKWVQCLQQQCAEASNKHGCVHVHDAYWPVIGKPSRALSFHDLLSALFGIITNDPISKRLSQLIAKRINAIVDSGRPQRVHCSIVPVTGSDCTVGGASTVGEMSDTSDRAMPKWVPRAVVVFWLGFLGALVARELFHQLSSFLLLLLVSLFLALAIEPGVNRLAKRGWRRGSGTLLILVSIIVFAGAFLGAVGTLVGNQVADVLTNSETYVNDTVNFINDTFNANVDPGEVNASISDPKGPVQRFIDNQQRRVVSLSASALGVLLQLLSITLFTFYLVADGPRLRRVICARLPEERQRLVLKTWDLAIDKTGGYLYSRALLALVSAFFHWIAFQAIGTPAPIAMALWVGIVSQFLPVVGTYLAGVLPLLLTFLESPINAAFVLAFILIYQQLENYLISPRITARTMHVHAAVAFASAIVGGAILGPIGAVLALPAAAMMQSLFSSWGQRHEVIDDELVRFTPRVKRERRKKA